MREKRGKTWKIRGTAEKCEKSRETLEECGKRGNAENRGKRGETWKAWGSVEKRGK